MSDSWMWFIRSMSENWGDQLRKVALEIIENSFLGDHDWLENDISIQSLSKAMPEIWENAGDVFKRELLYRVFKAGANTNIVKQRKLDAVIDSAAWIFRGVLTHLTGNDPYNMNHQVVGSDHPEACSRLSQGVRRDVLRLFGYLVIDENAKCIIDQVHASTPRRLTSQSSHS